uniref:Uncharacterized protein n=1 Tax=Trypanosoma congolense (strain IL3000) TaxID=1068625 RepID=G0V062_TRYCI|nr:hypothetical protein, unlikely [Trypanosoma congolense IL3000]
MILYPHIKNVYRCIQRKARKKKIHPRLTPSATTRGRFRDLLPDRCGAVKTCSFHQKTQTPMKMCGRYMYICNIYVHVMKSKCKLTREVIKAPIEMRFTSKRTQRFK